MLLVTFGVHMWCNTHFSTVSRHIYVFISIQGCEQYIQKKKIYDLCRTRQINNMAVCCQTSPSSKLGKETIWQFVVKLHRVRNSANIELASRLSNFRRVHCGDTTRRNVALVTTTCHAASPYWMETAELQTRQTVCPVYVSKNWAKFGTG
jgi:hypothetical protein